jgi:hypothetical protein
LATKVARLERINQQGNTHQPFFAVAIQDLQSVGKLHAQTLWGDGGTKAMIYCQGTVCQRCILAALWTIKLGLTKVVHQAKPLKYSEKMLYFVPVYSRCSNVLPLTSIYSWQQLGRDIRPIMQGSCLLVAAASTIRVVRPSSESTGEVCIRALMCLHRKKFIGVRSGNLGGQAIVLPRPIQRSL